eukprot:5880404-Prymnesium_polylepis.1
MVEAWRAAGRGELKLILWQVAHAIKRSVHDITAHCNLVAANLQRGREHPRIRLRAAHGASPRVVAAPWPLRCRAAVEEHRRR